MPAGEPTPDSSSGDNVDDKGKVYTEEELQQRLKGQGKELKKRDEEIALLLKNKQEREGADEETKRKKLEKQGEHKKGWDDERLAHAATKEKHAALEAELKEANAALAAIEEANRKALGERIAALPETLKAQAEAYGELLQDPDNFDRVSVLLVGHETASGKPPIRNIRGEAGRTIDPIKPSDARGAFRAKARDFILGGGK